MGAWADILLNPIGYGVVAVLSPTERYQAMRRFHPPSAWDFMRDRWFILTGLSVIFILTVVLMAVRRMRRQRENQTDQQQFDEECLRRGLTAAEHEILTGIVERSGLHRKMSIFSMMPAFHKGAARLMQERFARGDSIVERKRLNVAIQSIKEKLDFRATDQAYGVKRSRHDKGISSRAIPEGKLVTLHPVGTDENTVIEGVVTRNDDFELVVRTAIPVASPPGQAWNVRYRFGSATWGFDALTLACTPEGLELSHSDNVIFINRRRFVRAVVRRPALLARFPMIEAKGHRKGLAIPFQQATVTEISGPGLRLQCDLDVRPGERLLVVFQLDDGRIVQDLAEVRGSRDTAVSSSIGVELIGLSDAGVNELIRVTNRIAVQQGGDIEVASEDLILAGGQTHE